MKLRDTRQYTLEALARYWPRGTETVRALPIVDAGNAIEHDLPPAVRMVALPDWAAEFGDAGAILVPSQCVLDGPEAEWQRTDWLGAAFWYLGGVAERAFERLHGPIHSYSFRLAGWDERIWRRAWVNRIALFLRRWVGQQAGSRESGLLGDVPAPEIVLTHDVDAIRKTLSIRLKQCAFNVFNAVRETAHGEFHGAAAKAGDAIQFLIGGADYDRIHEVARLEESRGLRSQFNVYGGPGGWRRTPKQLLLDPAYDVCTSPIASQLREMRANGWTVGLHQSFDAWHDADAMRTERMRVEQALDAPVTTCRQHWLRFGWAETWKAQQEAGFRLDTTLGFNDRPGFRNGAALRFTPWDPMRNEAIELEALPLVLMDSQLYDYSILRDDERRGHISDWIDEVKVVRGQASVLWHPHTLSEDYGWGMGFDTLLECIGNA